MTDIPADRPTVPEEQESGGDEFFNVGAPLHAVRPGYVRRSADEMLFKTAMSGHYAHVVAPDRTGKSSLIAATAARLKNNGVRVAVLDLAQIADRDGGTDAGRWYYSIAYRITRQLRLKVDLQGWWQEKTFLSNRQRLVEFYAEIVLQNISEQIVIFVDEVQRIADLPFEEHLLASIRAAHNARVTEPEFSRLAFVLIGECDPLFLINDEQLSPFPIAQEIHLSDFSRQDLDVFATELNLSPVDAEIALDRIFYWTGGQPYLSQKLARAVSRERLMGEVSEQVDQIAIQQLAGRSALTSEPHMSHIHRAVTGARKSQEALLTLYGQVRKGIRVPFDPESKPQRRLQAIGLVVVDSDNMLQVRSKAYEAVFTARWANENLPMHWRGPALAVALLLALTALPFAYTQLLPKPYMRAMSMPAIELEAVADAYVNLRSFPGHAAAADRMFRSVLENRARQATERGEIQEIVRYAAQLPTRENFAENLRAEFWDRQVSRAMQTENRDAALLASLESLVLPSPQRRRRAASLIGHDYAELYATIPAQQSDGVVLDRESMLLSYHSGASVSQWFPGDQGLQYREPWTLSALEVTPLVRRVVVDQEGVVNRVGLTINVSHPRLSDIRAKIIAPSGRTAEFSFTVPVSAANEEIRIDSAMFTPLRSEPLNGTWTLSLRDEGTGVTGHLISWNLSLNSQGLVESFERGLDIPDPLERDSENLWFSPNGRYAIARALQSDSARLWDLRFAQAARTIAVPESERVLGLSANADYLVTLTPEAVNLWRTSDGVRFASLAVGAATANVILSANGNYMLVQNRGELDTSFELWSLDGAEIVSRLQVAGTPALVSIDAAANHLAVADYDRAVRVWNFRSGELLSQLDLSTQPSAITLSANGETLAAIHGDQGVSVWRIDRPAAPVLQRSGRNGWHAEFSQSGARLLVGNHREGFQAFRSVDGTPIGPMLHPGLGAGELVAFSHSEDFVVTASPNGVGRYWEIPANTTTAASEEGASSSHQVWRESANLVSALAPDGQRIAIGDDSGHVHVRRVQDLDGAIEDDAEEISFLGHRNAVVSIVFSPDGSLVASTDTEGNIRLWDAATGQPRAFSATAPLGTIRRMAFSPSGIHLAVLSGQRIRIMDTASGALISDMALGQAFGVLAFAQDRQLYLGGESGALRSFYADTAGNWHLRHVWQGEQAIRGIAVSAARELLVVVDAQNQARLLNPADGRVGLAVLTVPEEVVDLAFSPSESRVVFRTARWIHRALVSPGGLFWTDAIRAPSSMGGSELVFAASDGTVTAGTHVTDPTGDRILILTRDSGVAEIAELRFSYAEGPTVFGNRASLVAEWSEKLNGPSISDFVREGF